MTREELKKIPFKWMGHASWDDEYTTTYHNKEYGIGFCDHTPRKPHGRSYRHYAYKGKVYRSVDKLLEAINKAEEQ